MSSMQYGPGGASIAIPTGPAPDYNQMIQNDPWYKQSLEWLKGDAAVQKERLARDKTLAQQLYDLNVAQANASANSGGDYGMAAAQANADLQKQVAAHDDKLKEEYIREAMASRGMYDSGQRQFEQQERVFDYDTLLKGIQIDLDARASAAAQSRSEAQSRLALQLQEMQIRHGASMQGIDDTLADLDRSVARGTGESAFDTYKRLLQSGQLNAPSSMAVWDPTTLTYKTSDGKMYNQNGQPVTSPVPLPSVPRAPGGYVEPPLPTVTQFPNSRPVVNPLPGGGYRAV